MKPSVTQLIDLLNKPALLGWANRQGLLGVDIAKERQRAKDDGASLHSQIEAETFENEIHAQQYARFMADKTILKREGKIETQWFVGRIDCKFHYLGLDYLIDYKSSRGLYLGNKLQLAAYGMAEPYDRLAVVHVPSFELIESRIEKERAKYERIMIDLASIWSLMQDLGERL